MAINSAAVTSAIAALSVNGVTMKDVTAIPDSVAHRDCPIFFPMPGNWIGASDAASEDRSTFGAAADRFWQVQRNLIYVFLHSQVGTGRGNLDNYSDAVTKTEALITALVKLDVSGVDVMSVTHTPLGVMNSPTQAKFTGCEFTVTIRERINA